MSKADVFKIKTTRQKLLRALDMIHPGCLMLEDLYNVVCQIGYDKGLFAKDITYFFDKDWIEFIDDKLGGADKFMDKTIKLTAEGKQIAEGTQTDPALEL